MRDNVRDISQNKTIIKTLWLFYSKAMNKLEENRIATIDCNLYEELSETLFDDIYDELNEIEKKIIISWGKIQ